MFCMRVARDDYPGLPDGKEFEPACEGTGQPRLAPRPRLQALLNRRAELVQAMDQVFAEDAGAQVPDVALFADKELHNFLGSLIPFYDDNTMPRSTRALAKVAEKLLNENDPRARKVLETFARLSPRVGYRAPGDVLAAVRPMLRYPRMDQMSQETLGFVGEGGAAHEELKAVLRAATLEMAEPAEVVTDEGADKTTLHTVTELLMRPDPLQETPEQPSSFAGPSDPAKWFVVRDLKANAVTTLAAAGVSPLPSPFPVAGRQDSARRLPDGRAVAADGAPLYDYRDANRTLLAALIRDQKPLLERKTPGEKAAVENLLRGIKAIIGEYKPRVEAFRINDAAVTGNYAFTGPAVEESPLLDLVHGLTNALRYPETQRVVRLVKELLAKHENEAAAPVYAGLQIDRRADNYPSVQPMGVDGQPGGPHEFWDDLIAQGMRMAQRPGLFKDVILSFAKPEGAANARLLARFMRYKDEVKYNGAPLAPGPDGAYSQADADRFNELVVHELTQEVVRGMPNADVGMNRSLFQRLMSTIQATNGSPNCNKEGAELAVQSVVAGLTLNLKFPDPGSKDLIIGGGLPVLYPQCPGPTLGTKYQRCAFVQQPNGAETHMRSIIGRAVAKPKDEQLICLAEAQGRDIGETQEHDSQIHGFTLSPTPESIARFMYVPRNAWTSSLFDPLPTVHGVPLVDYEPNMLFALEAKQNTVKVGDAPLSFLDASAGLTQAFDDHQEFEDTEDGEVAKGGYMFADLLSVLHMHWSSRKSTGCPITNPAQNPICAMLKLDAKACNAGCTQSLDPKKPFYSKQTDLVSYEPLLIEAFEDERLGDLLAMSTQVVEKLQIPCEDGQTRDGVTILADFVERMLKPDPELTYYSNKARKYAMTNTCVETTDAKGAPACACPPGSSPVDASKPDSDCRVAATNAIVPRGRIIPQTTPLHLVLDALNRFDAAFKDPAYADRLTPWRAARSVLVDQFLTVTKTPSAMAPNDPTKATYTMANPRARAVGVTLLQWLDERIDLYRCKERASSSEPCVPDAARLNDWVTKLPDRLASVLGHPLLGRALDLYEKLWAADAPAAEMAAFNSYLLDPANADAFAGVVLAAADTLQIVDRDRELSPAIQFGALALAENAFTALDSLQSGPVEPETAEGTTLRALEVTRKIADLQRGKSEPSAISRILKNAVLSNANLGGRAPLEVLIDAVADVNRATPEADTTVPHTYEDNRKVFDQLKFFLSDQDRGLERLYNVIANRKVTN